MALLVQKFGGTSVADVERIQAVARRIAASREQGHDLNKGAVLMDGARVWHGSEAIAVLCRQLTPTDPLLQLLHGLFRDSRRANLLYPGLLAARQLALGLQGLPLDPDRA